MKWEGVIHTIRESTWTRYNKYRVVLAIRDDVDRVCWMSEKQMAQLETAFGENMYSNKHRLVVGVFEDNRYCYCKKEFHNKKREFKKPIQYDVSDLWEQDDDDSNKPI